MYKYNICIYIYVYLYATRTCLDQKKNNPSDKSLIGLRQMKEYSRKCTGAEHFR